MVLKALTDIVVVVASCDYMSEEEQHQDKIDISSRLKFWPKMNMTFGKVNAKAAAIAADQDDSIIPLLKFQAN